MVRLVVENYFHFFRKRFQKMELSFRFQFSMKILENAFGWNGGVFIFHFRKLEIEFRKFWKTTKYSFLIYIEVRKLKNFIFLKNFWKMNEPNVFSKFSFSIEFFLENWKIFHNQTHPKLRKKTKDIPLITNQLLAFLLLYKFDWYCGLL